MDKEITLDEVQGIGPAAVRGLKSVGITSLEDLLTYYPKRYEDYSKLLQINEIKPGQVSIKGKISNIVGRYVRRGMHITEAVLNDKTGSVRLVWFNQPYRASSIKVSSEYFVSGKFQLSRQRLSIINPTIELVSDFPLNTARIIPVYPQNKLIKSSQIRKFIKNALVYSTNIEDIIPPNIIKKYDILPKKQAVRLIHFPSTVQELDKATYSLGFSELFELILANIINRKELNRANSVQIKFDEKLAKNFVSNLAYKLTDDQRIVTWQILRDLDNKHAMNRLLEGDVGSGKTVVSAMAVAMTISQDYQVFILAPTEVLARQHANTYSDLLKPLGLDHYVTLLVGSMNKKQKTIAYQNIESSKSKVIIGTHAILQESLNVDELGLIIVDEQHRFGVDQRKKLLKKSGHMVHMLSMSATPIPRSLALTVFGDLDISRIKTMPKSRKKVSTNLVVQNERTTIYKGLISNLSQGEQMFVVCPLIDNSDFISARSANVVFDELASLYKDYKVALLHGRLSSIEKRNIMQDFVDNRINVLVSTTVIEVGVDVPNATIMCVESPERFGLAQIHQLRGRIGRGEKPGYCFLMQTDNDPPSKRLRAIKSSNDGFRLAEFDLKIRGPGAIYGKTQHGILDLKMVDLSNQSLINSARRAAKELLNNDPEMLQYDGLRKRIEKLQKVTHLN